MHDEGMLHTLKTDAYAYGNRDYGFERPAQGNTIQ